MSRKTEVAHWHTPQLLGVGSRLENFALTRTQILPNSNWLLPSAFLLLLLRREKDLLVGLEWEPGGES